MRVHSLRVRENWRFGRLWALTVTDNMVQISALQERVDDEFHSATLAVVQCDLGGWINRQQQEVIEYLRTATRAPRIPNDSSLWSSSFLSS